MRKSIFILFLLVLGFSTQAQNSSEVREKIVANSDAMQKAMASGDFEKFGSFFSEDVIFKMTGKEPLNGRSAVTLAHKPMAEGGMKVIVNTDEVLDFGDYAYEIGNYEIHAQDGKKVDYGTYATLWKMKNGDWKIYRDVISSSVSTQ